MKKGMICADNLTPVVNPGCKLSWRISGHCQPLRTCGLKSLITYQACSGSGLASSLDIRSNQDLMSWCYIHVAWTGRAHRNMGLLIKMHLKCFLRNSFNARRATSKINSQNGIKAVVSPRQPCVASNQTVSYNHLFSSLATRAELHPRNIIPSSCLPPPLLILSLSTTMCASRNHSLIKRISLAPLQ